MRLGCYQGVDCTVYITFILCLFTVGLYMTTLCIGCKLQVFYTASPSHHGAAVYSLACRTAGCSKCHFTVQYWSVCTAALEYSKQRGKKVVCCHRIL